MHVTTTGFGAMPENFVVQGLIQRVKSQEGRGGEGGQVTIIV